MLYSNIELELFQTYLFSLKKIEPKKRYFDLVKIIEADKCLYGLFQRTDDGQENDGNGSLAHMFSFLLITIFVDCIYYS